MVWVLGYRVGGLGLRVDGWGVRVWGSGFGVQGLGFRGWGLGRTVHGVRFKFLVYRVSGVGQYLRWILPRGERASGVRPRVLGGTFKA